MGQNLAVLEIYRGILSARAGFEGMPRGMKDDTIYLILMAKLDAF
jgi:hypothetical protein